MARSSKYFQYQYLTVALVDHAWSLSSPPQLPDASSRSGCSCCSDFSTKLLVAGFPPFKVITPKLAAVLVSSNAVLPVVGSLVFPWPQIAVGQRDLQNGMKAKQKLGFCAKGTNKHNPEISKKNHSMKQMVGGQKRR